MPGGSRKGSIIQDMRGWPGLLLRLLSCTAFFWVFLWAFSWPTGTRNLATVNGTVTSYVRTGVRAASMGGGQLEKATYGISQRIGERDTVRTVWIDVGNLNPARKPELPLLVGREIDAKIGFGEEVYGFSVGRNPPDIWFTAEATIAAKWAMFVQTLLITAGIALFFAIITSLDVFRRKPIA
jgi:hypothetical protein